MKEKSDKNIDQSQLNGNIESSLQKNNLSQCIKSDASSTEKKMSTTENQDIDSNQSSPTIVRSKNFYDGDTIGFDEHTQHHSLAPTLPIYSPHSPLLTDETAHHLKKSKLSARYINNSILRNTVNNYFKHDTENFSVNQTSTITTSSSKLLCYCEKKALNSIETSKNKTELDSGGAKRLVQTRNAATSPHLDIRKLGSMTTLIPSPSLTNELCLNSTDSKNDKIKTKNISVLKINNERNQKDIVVKTNSVGETKPQKLLRTTRSLSPRPPIRHHHAMLVSDPNNVDSQVSFLSNTKARTYKQQIHKVCRSEQSSPNVVEGMEIQFSYNEPTNRSTGCLGNVFSDPWVKIKGSDNISPPSLKAKLEQRLHQVKTVNENNKDPWVKRTDTESFSKSSRNELFRQSKSFSVSKFDVDSIVKIPRLLNSSKSPGYLKEDILSNAIDNTKQLQSAPSSPQFLATPENIFASSTYITNSTKCFIEKIPTRSTSLSPARVNDTRNPFMDLQQPNSPPPLSVATETQNNQTNSKSKLNLRSTNYEFLNVYNPNFLNARHSFSFVSDKQKEEELQLNIRRLSDQMRRKESILTNSIKTFSSDRNVRENQKDENKVFMFSSDVNKTSARENVSKNRADFSEYLLQFRCSEAKKAAIDKEKSRLWKENNKLLTKIKVNQPVVINKTKQSSDCLLETTC